MEVLWRKIKQRKGTVNEGMGKMYRNVCFGSQGRQSPAIKVKEQDEVRGEENSKNMASKFKSSNEARLLRSEISQSLVVSSPMLPN